MIHPQYIVSLVDYNHGVFEVKPWNNYVYFRFVIYNSDVRILHKIKERFKSGKIIQKDDIFILILSKQLDNVIQFFRKNRLLNTTKHVEFLNWAYLNQKLIDEKDVLKSEKELKKIKRRLVKYDIVLPLSKDSGLREQKD